MVMRYRFVLCIVAIQLIAGGSTVLLANSGPNSSISRSEAQQQGLEGGPAATFNVTIYNGGQGMPGPTILGGPWTNVVPTIDSGGTVTLDLSPPAVITPGGVVWIAAWANLDSDQGQWYWNDNNVRHGANAQWRNPGGGFGTTCSGWGSIASCLGDPTGGPDLRFQIWGRPIGQSGDPILLYTQLDGTSDSAWIAQNFETAMDSYDCELADCWGASAPGWSVSRVVLEGTYTSAVDPCEDFTAFLARCTQSGIVQSRVTLSMNIDHSGETVLFDVDGTIYDAVIGDNGTSSRASISVSGLGSGDHTVTLVSPAGCFNPRVVTCPTLGKVDAEWEADDARWTAETVQAETRVATKLLGNYPNPFNPTTSISYQLSADSWVTLKVYNTLGEEVATLVNEHQMPGTKSAVWNGTNEAGNPVASGIYIYRLSTGNIVTSEKMMFVK